MLRTISYSMVLMLIAVSAFGEEPAEPDDGEKRISGMSIVGNDEAPKSLVIVPWKSSELGHTLEVSKGLYDGRQPVDREVFMRELAYYQIRAGSQQP
jgi:hypothetical protein